jgi:iron complex outermembrane receptor protein
MNRIGDLYMNRIALAVKSALGLAMLVPPALTLAATATDTSPLDEIVVTGIRKSVEQSIEAKRDSTELTEVVTAEDIGKMPDKNVADSLARLPGVTTSAAGANEGGFDENDRVSMRGTNPSLTQTLINGHGVAAGDWFVLDQVQTVGRSVSYTLLPSEIVSKVVVQKSSSASLVEGGVAGSVDIITRKPRCMRIYPRRPTVNTVRSRTSRMMRATLASCCSCSPKPGICGATASKSWVTTPLHPAVR